MFVAPGTNIAAGRNIAVREARHDWIVCTDAGCRPVRGWLGALKDARERVADIAAGTFVVEAETPLDRAVACAHYPVMDEIDDDDRSVRVAHRLFGRDFRARAGGRPFDGVLARGLGCGGRLPGARLRGRGPRVQRRGDRARLPATLAEEATVRWRPRTTLAANARMFATYTRGDIRTKGRKRARRASRGMDRRAARSSSKGGPPAGCSRRRARPPISGCRCAVRVARCPRASGGASRRSWR